MLYRSERTIFRDNYILQDWREKCKAIEYPATGIQRLCTDTKVKRKASSSEWYLFCWLLYHAYWLLCYKFQLDGTCIYNSPCLSFLGCLIIHNNLTGESY